MSHRFLIGVMIAGAACSKQSITAPPDRSASGSSVRSRDLEARATTTVFTQVRTRARRMSG